jgi:hypothetical protein
VGQKTGEYGRHDGRARAITVITGVETGWENPVVMRRDRLPTITVHGDPRAGLPSTLFNRVR